MWKVHNVFVILNCLQHKRFMFNRSNGRFQSVSVHVSGPKLHIASMEGSTRGRTKDVKLRAFLWQYTRQIKIPPGERPNGNSVGRECCREMGIHWLIYKDVGNLGLCSSLKFHDKKGSKEWQVL